jgi:CMP-N,N'-diacetyllegionaminic acid synthase
MKNLCIIPARSGSKGVPGKNTRPLNGKPLLQYTFDAAKDSKQIDRIILSTDCAVIASLAEAAGIDVPFIRPAELAQDDTPMLAVIQHAYEHSLSIGEVYDNIILLQPTCPFRIPGLVDNCIDSFLHKTADSLVTVKAVPHEYNPHWVFEANEEGLLQISTHDEQIIPSRQQLPQAYVRDGSVYIFKASNLQQYNSIYGKRIAYFEMSNTYHVNIDSPADWNRAEWMVQSMHCFN